MRASRPRDSGTHCPRCLLRRDICICNVLPDVRTKTEFLILRHIWEAGRPGNTGRLAALALPNSRILPCGGGNRLLSSAFDDAALQAPGTWLLWPDGPAGPRKIWEQTPPRRVAVLDATWHQARRLYRQTPLLQSLPRLALPAPRQNRERLRDQRRPDGLSTLEAIAAAVALLEGSETARPLEELYDEVVRRRNALRWGRNSPATGLRSDSL
ncbi:MAG: DTW domain-containing protein [Smithellaceae bacterium]|nr:DTW domain-containing protein [Syntrophaceae bacterium]MDD4240721.1 DTW domain-containing protein [Smithellaceae bacterium]NLX52772.1 DTW domain-containing protein [Deltaproteobacteria bacterium]